jgi:acetyl/propionyl-CoA carboxylase alpha subunit
VAPGFDPSAVRYRFDAAKLLADIIEHSLAMAREVRYDNIGTWEWIVSRDGTPFLMEVNTRIQVENGVSAAVSSIRGQDGTDLIAEQIRTALGAPLGYTQDDIRFDGVGLEYRIIAEDTDGNFTPWGGRIERFLVPERDWLSVHTHVPDDRPYDIPTEFDPNLALAIVRGGNLEEAAARGREFLDALVLEGKGFSGDALVSNVAFLRRMTEHILMF